MHFGDCSCTIIEARTLKIEVLQSYVLWISKFLKTGKCWKLIQGIAFARWKLPGVGRAAALRNRAGEKCAAPSCMSQAAEAALKHLQHSFWRIEAKRCYANLSLQNGHVTVRLFDGLFSISVLAPKGWRLPKELYRLVDRPHWFELEMSIPFEEFLCQAFREGALRASLW